MNKEQLIDLGLTEEQATKVVDGFKGYVPSSRFNEVNEARKEAEQRVRVLTGEKEELSKSFEALKGESEAAKAKYEGEISTLKINGATERALTAHGAKNLKAVMALIDFSKLKLNGEKLEGIDEQIENLIKDENSSFMFKQKEQAAPTGMKAGESSPKVGKPVAEMNYSERVAYLAAGGKL